MASFTDKIEEGRLLNKTANGYKVFRYEIKKDGKKLNPVLFIRKLVAEYFLPPKSGEQNYVLYLDHNKSNNRVTNLQWATKQEMREHNKKNPFVIEAQKNEKKNRNPNRYKLTPTRVMLIKIKLFDPNCKTRIKMLAKRFGISKTQLYRIKRGQCWKNVTID